MLGIDSLVVIGLATASIGTIYESNGVIDRSFWIRNDGQQPVTLVQGYTSCGCTTIDFCKDTPIAVGDSTMVTLHFNPRGKGGEFYESGTVVHVVDEKRIFTNVAIEGNCITSAETLQLQFPIQLAEGLRQSRNHFDVGYMSTGQSKTLYTTILHEDEDNRRELLNVDITIDPNMPKGLQHITKTLTTTHRGKTVSINVVIDVFVK